MLCQVLRGLASLLGQGEEGVVFCAALALACMSLSEVTCHTLLGLPSVPPHAEEPGGSSFRSFWLTRHYCLPAYILFLSGLQALLCAGSGPAAAQTARFALSCLAAEEVGHALVLGIPAFPFLLDGLCSCLLEEEPGGSWFADVLVGLFVCQSLLLMVCILPASRCGPSKGTTWLQGTTKDC